MPGAVLHAGKWRIKPSGQLPIFLRFMINSSFTLENAQKADIHSPLSNRTYLNHMMYWPASEYNVFEEEILHHMKAGDGWFETYCTRELHRAEQLYAQGPELSHVNWKEKTNEEMATVLEKLLQDYRELACPWYAQYPLDEYFEDAIEHKLGEYIPLDHPDFRKFVLIFTDPKEMTEVSEERWSLVRMAKNFIEKKEQMTNLSDSAVRQIITHLDRFAYINRGLATSKPYTVEDIISRIREILHKVGTGTQIDYLIYEASAEKVAKEYTWALSQIKPKDDFQYIIDQARLHSYLRNRRVEAFFNADYGASFMYEEIARRANFNPDWIMEISIPEMFGALRGESLPSEDEMHNRLQNYAMIVRKASTILVTDPLEIKKMEQEYSVHVESAEIIHGKMACLGGIIIGRAKVCLDKKEIYKIERGDILVAQFTTPDFVPAMEKAAAIVADQGGLSSHAAIVSRELGVPCVIATQNATRLIHDNDLLEINAQTGVVKIIEHAQ